MKNIHTVSIKVQYKGQSIYESNDAYGTADRALDGIIGMLENGNLTIVYLHPQVSLDELQTKLEKHFGNDVEVREGVSEGCYGARTGKTLNGLTCYFDADLLPAEWRDSDGDLVVNPVHLIDQANGELVEGLSGDLILDALYEVMEYSSNNTYNYAGQTKEDPSFAFDMDYSVVESDKKALLVVKFHHGGDVRGNYGNRMVFKFDSIEDIYSVIYPVHYI